MRTHFTLLYWKRDKTKNDQLIQVHHLELVQCCAVEQTDALREKWPQFHTLNHFADSKGLKGQRSWPPLFHPTEYQNFGLLWNYLLYFYHVIERCLDKSINRNQWTNQVWQCTLLNVSLSNWKSIVYKQIMQTLESRGEGIL